MFLLARLVLDARVASYVGALIAGEPELGPVLEHIARRESRLELVGVHPADLWMERTLGEGYSTRGVHGCVAAFTLPHLGAWAWPYPWLLDVPLVSAFASAKRATHWRCRATRGCRSWLGLAS